MPRRQLDFYETPNHYVDALVDVIGVNLHKVYDCCSGQRAIITRLRERGYTGKIYSNDLDNDRPAKTHYNAAINGHAWGRLGIDWCITNPPFSDELAILTHALRWHQNVAFLARLSFLEPTLDRRTFWQLHDSDCRIIVLPRYSFRLNDDGKKQTDSVTCCWLIFTERRSALREGTDPQGVTISRRFA
jgi:hypothetical protein